MIHLTRSRRSKFFRSRFFLHMLLAHSSKKGLTLLENIMAILLIAVTSTAIVPPLFVASATRVQAKRAEQALQIAQSEVARLRALIEQNPSVTLPAGMPPDTYNNNLIETGMITDVEGPSADSGWCRSIGTNADAALNGNTYEWQSFPDANQYLRIDVDGDADNSACNEEFIMQVFRSERDQSSQLQLGVRVYAGSAVDALARGENLEKELARLGLTTGAGQQPRRPLAALYTKISAVNSTGIEPMCRFQAHEDCS